RRKARREAGWEKPAGRAMRRGAGRCCTPKAPIATAASNPAVGCYCVGTAWSSATCSYAKPICPAGVNCKSATAVSKTAAKCAAADPLNLVGIIVPGERIPAISGRSVTFRDGVLDVEDALLASGY